LRVAVAGGIGVLQPHEAGASLADKAHHAIRELIVTLELPPGAVIDERALIERLSIGRTPVREALRRLAQERLVEVYPRRGMFVSGVDVRELARISEVRAALEPEAARLAAERATEPEREELAALLHELDGEGLGERELMALDERIHRAVYRCAHNDLLEATLEQYYVLSLRIWMMGIDRAHELDAAVRQHQELLESIRDGDGVRAAAVMRDHVQNFEQAMRRVLLTV
jgi:DNA-binding GntR family transcriptional regulator